MKKRISDRELSAYLDGESTRPVEVEKRIQESHEIARRFAAISRLSERLRALPEPEPRLGFTGRVLASIAEPAAEPRLGWRLPATLSLAAVAAVFGLVSMFGPNDSATDSGVRPLMVTDTEDSATLFAQLEEHVQANPGSEIALADGLFSEPAPINELPEVILPAVAPTTWSDQFSGRGMSGGYEMEFHSLSDPERAIFAQLLEEHASANDPGQAAHEG